jgi:hypothetical protein
MDRSSAMLSLPVELRLPIIHHIRDSIPWPSFEEVDASGSIGALKEFYKVIIALSRYHPEWTPIAQSELFRNIYAGDEKGMKLLLQLLRGDGKFREYTKHSRSALIGEPNRQWGDSGRLEGYLGKLAEYCPDLEELSCYDMQVRLVGFGTSYSVTLERFWILISFVLQDNSKD